VASQLRADNCTRDNGVMRFVIYAAAALTTLILGACGPTFNWRETSITSTPLTALFPCKPQKASRRLLLGGAEVELQMTGCETGGVTFAIGHAAVRNPSMTALALSQWRESTLAGMRATSSSATAWQLVGALEVPQSLRVKAIGSRPGGGALVLQGAWFTRDNEVFGALSYGGSLSPDIADTFFSGLKFR
jgi:hypothetical protein